MSNLIDVDRQMLEGLGQRSPGSLDGDGTGLNAGVHSLGDRHKLKGVDLLHYSSESTNNFIFNSSTHKKTTSCIFTSSLLLLQA